MKIDSINFTAKYTQSIKNQFERGKKRYKNSPAECEKYENAIKAIDDFPLGLVITSMQRASSCTGRMLFPIVVYENEDTIIPAQKRTVDSFYKKAIKTQELSTLDGIEALKRDIEENF